ncbi:MAG: redoxin domain-containing protein [bacterium]|nr:redoxin domain-containing protein [bacterium]
MTTEAAASTTSERSRPPRNHAIWLGVLITLFGAFSYFGPLSRFPVLRDFPWINLPLVLVGLLFSSWGLWRAVKPSAIYRGKILGSLGFALSLLLTVVFHWYIFDYSYDVPAPNDAVPIRSAAPDFALTDHDGKSVRLGDYRGKKVVLTFYRGHW